MEAGKALPAGRRPFTVRARRPLTARAQRGAGGEEQAEAKAAASAAASGLLFPFISLFCISFFFVSPILPSLHPSPSGSLLLVKGLEHMSCEELGLFSLEKRGSRRDLTALDISLSRGCGRVGVGLFCEESSDRREDMAAPGQVRVGHQEGLVFRRDAQILELTS